MVGQEMVQASIFDPATGEILETIFGKKAAVELAAAGRGIAYGAEYPPSSYMIDVPSGTAAIRPRLIATTTAHGFDLSELPPAGTVLRVASNFVAAEIPATAAQVAVCERDVGEIEVVPPFPWVGCTVEVRGQAATPPAGAQVIEPDLAMMQAAMLREADARADRTKATMLGNPTPERIEVWRLTRSLYEVFTAGTNTVADDDAMAERIRYSGLTVAQELARIGAKIDFETWVTHRTKGLQEALEARVTAAATAQEVLTAVFWAEAEEAAALAEADFRR